MANDYMVDNLSKLSSVRMYDLFGYDKNDINLFWLGFIY